MEERTAPTQISTGSTAGDPTKQDPSAVSSANLDRANGVPIFINRNYALLWVGRTISIGGDYVFNTTLVLWVSIQVAAGQSWAPLAVSGVVLAAGLPAILVSLIAGVFADRWDRRRAMIHTNLLNVGLIAALIPVALLPTSTLPPGWKLSLIYLLVFLTGVVTRFYIPSSVALVGDIVDEADRPRASGLNQMSYSFCSIAGPSLATLLFFIFGPPLAILINALSFLAASLTVLLIHSPHTPLRAPSSRRRNFWDEFRTGIDFCFHHTILRVLLITTALIFIQEGAERTLTIFFVGQNLHAPSGDYGFLLTASAVGVAVGALLTTVFARYLSMGRLFGLSLLLAGGLELLYARQSNLLPVLIICTLQGLLFGAFNIALSPLMLHAAPDHMRGRASSILGTLTGVSLMLSTAVAGWLDSTLLRNFHTTLFGISFGPVDTIFTFAGIITILSGYYALVNLRRVRLKGEHSREKAN